MRLVWCFISLLLLSSFVNAERIAFLPFEDISFDRKGEEKVAELISSIFPQGGFSLVDQDKVKRLFPFSVQKELGTITLEIAYTLGELLDADIIVVGKVREFAAGRLVIHSSFINTRKRPDPKLPDRLLSLFWSQFGQTLQIKKVISDSELVIRAGEDVVRIGDRFDIIRENERIGRGEVVKVGQYESELFLLEMEKRVSPFDVVRREPFDLGKGKLAVLVTSRPRAKVFWEREAFGNTPVLFTKTDGGLLKLKREGYSPWQIELDYHHPYSILDLSLLFVALKEEIKPKRYGSLLIASSPQNAMVYLDGELVGLTPCFVPNILCGLHSVVVKKEGFETVEKKVLVEKDTEIRVELTTRLIPKLPPPLKRKRERHSEVITVPTAHSLSSGEIVIGLNYPYLFVLQVGLPTKIATEVKVKGLEVGLKYSLKEWLGLDLWCSAYNMRKGEKEKEKGVSSVMSFPIEQAFAHIGGGYLWKREDKGLRYFCGVEIPFGKIDILAEYDSEEGVSLGLRSKLEKMWVMFGVGKSDGDIRYDASISFHRKPLTSYTES